MVVRFIVRKWLLIVVLVMVIVAITASIYFVYQASRPRICLCPAEFWVDLLVYNGSELILNKTLIAGPPCPCAGFHGWEPPVFTMSFLPLGEQHCIRLTNITPPVGVVNFTCYTIGGVSQFVVPTSICVQPSNLSSAVGLINEFLSYNRPSLDMAFNGTVKLLMGMPVVREYVGNGRLVLAGEGFITDMTKSGNYLIINVVGIEYTINVVMPNGTRIGIIHVKYYQSELRVGRTLIPVAERIEVILMPKSVVQEINKIRV
ncbi:MAG: hypothetical protein ACP5GY_03140 [Vulcanisaeta sp.]